MEAGSKDRPPMLAPANYVQWKSRTKRYIDTKSNHELIHYCLENPTYKLDWQDVEVPVSEEVQSLRLKGFNSSTRSQQAAIRNRGKAHGTEEKQLSILHNPSMIKNLLWIGNVAGARKNVGLLVVQKSGIQCYNCKEFRHVARECQKPKREKDAAYHREKMLLYQELEAHYMYMAQLQEVTPDAADSGPIFDDEPL
nr:hypothetical protein [Tanacetum cinerariifolium]